MRVEDRFEGKLASDWEAPRASWISADVQLRGRMKLEPWDPHTGTIRPLDGSPADDHGEAITRFKLTRPPIRSVSVVGGEAEN